MSVVLLDVDYGLAIGIGVALLMVILRDRYFQIRNLVQYKESNNFVDETLTNLNDNQTKYNLDSLNIKLFKVQNSIYFVNCENFKSELYKSYGFSPDEKLLSLNSNDEENKNCLPNKRDPDIILDFSAVNYLDTNGIKTLKEIVEDFKKVNVFVYICEPQGKINFLFLFIKKI